MRAQVLVAPGEPLRLSELAVPSPGSGEVLVRIAAAGLNPLDTKIALGEAAHAQVEAPAVLGLDAAGTVVATGPGVSGFDVGDEVFGMIGGVGGVQGSLAEYAAVDADLLAHKPSAWSMAEAAAVPLGFITAWEGLVDRARVWATGRHGQAEVLRELGAVPIDFERESVEDYVAEHTAGRGFDIVLDTLGGANLDRSFTAVKRYTGHVVSSLGWGAHSLAPLSFRGATYSGVFTLLPLLTGEGRAAHGRILEAASALGSQGALRALVAHEGFDLADADRALVQVTRGVPAGKVVVGIR